MATKTTTPGLESIDRLEEKIKLLVNTIVRIKAEHVRAGEENARLKGEIETLKARISTAESTGAEVTALREERELIKGRVTEMLQQLDGLNL